MNCLSLIDRQSEFEEDKLGDFRNGIEALRKKGTWIKDNIIRLYFRLVPELAYEETGKYLDQRT